MILPYGLALTAGTMPIAFLPALPPQALCLLLLAAGSAAVLHRCTRIPGLVVVGLAYALLVADARLHPQLDSSLAGKDLEVQGLVTGLPEHGDRSTRFRLRTISARYAQTSVELPPTLRLNWYHPRARELASGEVWSFTVRLREPRGMNNPGGFDYERWLFQEGIGATGHVRDAGAATRLQAATPSLDGLRDRVRRAVSGAIPDSATAGLFNALAVGDRSGIGDDQWDTLLVTGTNHLIAISGLHVGLAALSGFLVGRLVWRSVPVLRNRTARPVFAACTGLVFATCYAALAGFAIPTQRALAMLVAGLGMVILRRRARPDEILGVALIAVIILDPLAVLAPGFWLSFAAVAAILAMVAARVVPPGRTEAWLRLQFGIAVALLPILFLLFTRTSVIGPLANLVAVPWVSVLVVPPVLLGALTAPLWPDAGGMLLTMASWSFAPLWWFLDFLAGLPGAELHRAAPGIVALLLAIAGVVLLLAPRGLPGRAAGVACLLPLFAVHGSAPEQGAFRLELLDVGAGTAVIVRTSEKTLVYGAGPRFSDAFDAGSAALVPYLRQSGVSAIDKLVIPGQRNAVAGGAASLLTQMPVEEIRGVMDGVEALSAQVRPCRRGDKWIWDGVQFDILHPAAGDMARLDDDDRSCVLRVRAGGHTLVLPGDLQRRGLWTLVTREPDLVPDMLLVPRQGSHRARVAGVAESLSPTWLLVSGAADAELAELYASAQIVSTDCHGAIRFRMNPDGTMSGPHLRTVEQPRFWRTGCS